MIDRLKKIAALFVAVAVVFVLLGNDVAHAAGLKSKVAILPVIVQSSQNLGYLGVGVREMLASRFAAASGVSILERTAVDQALAAVGRGMEPSGTTEVIELSKRLSAEHLVATSILSLGGGMSIDIRVYTVTAAGEATLDGFYATVASEAEVIAAIDRLAVKIGQKKFGLPSTAGSPETTNSGDSAKVALPAVLPSVHPDRAFVLPVKPETGGALPSVSMISAVTPFSKSQNLEYELQAMDVGDIDGDGQDEVVVALKTEIVVYKRQGNKLNEMARIPLNSRYRMHGVFLADLNADKQNEIYVSAADHKGPNSLILEWREGKFQTIFKDVSWYIKPVQIPGEGLILAGQRGGFKAAIEPGIYRLKKEGKKYVEGARITSVPDEINLFNFVYADIDGDGRHELVAIDSLDYLRVFDMEGRALWASGDHYGGVTRYVGGSGDFDWTSNDKNKPEEFFIPSRMMAVDVNADGRTDVVVKKDIGESTGLFKSSRKFPSGAVDALAWNGIALTSIWTSGKIDGYIADYQVRPGSVASADAQKKGVLYFGLVLSEKGLFESATSTILFYPVPFYIAGVASVTQP